MMTFSPFTLGIFSILCLGSAVTAQADEKEKTPYEQALDRYNETQSRLPFLHHTDGRKRLANTRDPRALAILAKDYAKPDRYPEYTRYTLAHLIGQNFDFDEAVPQLDALRAANDDPIDTWLWVHAMRIHVNQVGDPEVVRIATTAKNALHRAAAILALGLSRHGRMKDAIVHNCVEFPKKAHDRCALLGAMSGALYENRRSVNDPDYRAALEAYIGLLDPKVGLTHVSKIQMARHLQWILNGPALFVNPEPWLELLSRGEIRQPKKTDTRASPSFFGIETEGERFCYIVDMSNSMCKPIEPSARPRNAPVTGKRKPKRKKGFVPSESDLPWGLIRSRWDLAREQLRISLLRLPDDKYFSVIGFGTDAVVFKSCKGMVRATKRNVDKVIAELDSIKPGPADSVKAPDGTLAGQTNMHAGLKRGFGMTRKGPVEAEDAAYVHPKVLTEGCDTIFLLSDGAPSYDDFRVTDRDYGEGRVVVEHEYGAAGRRTPNLNYHGPYDQHDWLVEDVRRMNAFRRIRMHCVGLGEANMSLLGRLAEVCNGETFSMGKKTK